jgi:hypothetical protein
MKKENIFYLKNIVDFYYPDENRSAVDIQSIVNIIRMEIQNFSDDDFSEIIISCFIPDLYSGMGKREKLFTKLTELMVGEWWRRLGGNYNLPTKKSGTEDVELIWNNISIVCDVKVFRLGRSQKAPNVKDFLKAFSVKHWIDNLYDKYRSKNITQKVIGGLVTYSSLHEWESDSEVYAECTNPEIPVVMLPYEVLALLLKYKRNIKILDFLNLWNYTQNYVRTSRKKEDYWAYVNTFIWNLIGISADDYVREIREYRESILLAVNEYRKIIQNSIDEDKKIITERVNGYKSIEDLKQYCINELGKSKTETANEYLRHIDDFRHY